MSKAAKHTLINTVFSYIGVVIGAFTMIFILPKVFGDERSSANYGGLVTELNYVFLYLIVASVSTTKTLIKFYPNLPDSEKGKLIGGLIWYQIIGLLISCLLFYFFSSSVELQIDGQTKDISNYFYGLIVVFTLNSFITSFSQVVEKTYFTTFFRDVFTKFWNFGIFVAYYYEVIDFNLFSILYFIQYVMVLLIYIIYFYRLKLVKLHLFDFSYFKNKEVLNYTFYSLLAGASATIITKVDIQMIKEFIGQEEVAYYSYALFFITVLQIPRNSITSISNNIISRDLNYLDFNAFKEKYQRISFIYGFSSLIVFLLILLGINQLMVIVGGKYGSETIKIVVIVLGLGRVIESVFVPNISILNFSKYYKYDMLFQLLTMVLVVVLNVALISTFEIIGAAISTSISLVLISMVRTWMVYSKFKLFPLSTKYFYFLIIVAATGVLYFVPIFNWTIQMGINNYLSAFISIVLKSILFVLINYAIALKLGIKEEFFNLKSTRK